MNERDLSEVSDAALVMAIARWRQEALAEAYRRHGGAVYGTAYRILANKEAAEDVVQTVFTALWDRADRYDPDRGSLRSFLLTMAHGRAIDALRSERGRKDRETRVGRQAGAPYDLEREVWDLTVAQQVRDALAHLSEGERQAIEMAYFGGHSYREVAEMLGQPEGTVKSRIRSGLTRLRGALVAAGVAAQ